MTKYYYYELTPVDIPWSCWMSLEDASSNIMSEIELGNIRLDLLEHLYTQAKKFNKFIHDLHLGKLSKQDFAYCSKVCYLPVLSDGWMMPIYMCKLVNNGTTYIAAPFPLDDILKDCISANLTTLK